MTENSVGARLREARTLRRLSLRSLAQSLGVSASLISQVETGKTQPSVSTLYAMATHLGLSLDELLGGAPAGTHAATRPDRTAATVPNVQRASDNAVLEMENGVRWEHLASEPGGPGDAVLVTYQPGGSSSVEGKLMRHSGIEYAYILEGSLTLQLEFETHVLGPGDSLQFDSIRPHLFTNNGTTVARGVWFVVGRRQQNDGLTAAPGAASAHDNSQLDSAVDVLRVMDNFHA
ncbi:helix-turn-helix domain-containing protein [Parafrigoribacterium humi]|uniref:helix-turn-helix domain-containing protein n=1 Tax=Parafrigoribacterium humi TaxID=3144664 RepID=UPI0032EE5555